MAVSEILHKGKKVVFADYTNCKTEQEMLDVLYSVKDYYLNCTEKLRILSDFTERSGTRNFMKQAGDLGKEVFDERTLKSAALGIIGIRKVLLSGYNMVMKQKLMAFDSKEEALDYLAE